MCYRLSDNFIELSSGNLDDLSFSFKNHRYFKKRW